MTEHYEDVGVIDYGRVADIVREEMLVEFVPNACIAAARVTTLALRRLGIHSEAIAVELEAFSPAHVEMTAHFYDLGRQPTEEEVDEWLKRGAWKVTLTFDEHAQAAVDHRDGMGYRGHVVVLAEQRTVLVDPTVAQVNRPAKGLVVEPPFAWEIEPDERDIIIPRANGTALRYQLVLGRRDFIKAPDWCAPGQERKGIQARVVDRVTKRLQEVVYAADHR